jgi:hypothetical protein
MAISESQKPFLINFLQLDAQKNTRRVAWCLADNTQSVIYSELMKLIKSA